MRTLIRKIFKKASIHGFSYIARTDIHLVERILWGILLFIGTYLSVDMCWNQFKRYKDNPTVFGVERIMGTREFPYVGVTMCSNYFDEEQADVIIQKKWNVTTGDKKHDYYKKFLQVLIEIEYNNLETLKPYANDEDLRNVDFLKTIWDINSSQFTNKTGKNKILGGDLHYSFSVVYRPKEDTTSTVFQSVITEVGLCFTTSFLYEYQNPLGFQREPLTDTEPKMCTPFDLCNLKVTPNVDSGDKIVAYIHNNKDVVEPDIKSVIRREINTNEISNVDVTLEIISAEEEVRNVPINYRKCRFSNENNLKYFKTYRPILCRIECRINAALKLCQCKPFFYVVGPKGPICNIKGLLCLAKNNWMNTKCDQCLEMCAVHKYTALKTTAHVFNEAKFARALLINLSLPKMGIRRRVVFSFDQLVIAFGGAASLFLGCSFLSFAQIFYYIIQYLEEKLKIMYRRYFKKN
ncbi:sodium channel protein Nach [Eupeodes corollae]|uniref:sodium channel protein Nach n=1 Tax=Eupeodes corollae TaxID=290404 RepID=UPI002490903F|nr:sodium channel protein Nach [Eupeodes corollae]